jgi:dTDP-glucose 4,6-dehydratase
MKWMITGGAGFIGTNFLRYILGKEDTEEVVCIDSLTYAGNYRNFESARNDPRFRFVKADITDREAVFDSFADNRCDIVINFAAESHVDLSIKNPGLFLRTNVLGTQVMMDACRKYDVPRFHQVSTDEVYGDLPLDRPDLLFNEDSPLRASSPYSASKAAADLLVQAYSRTYGLRTTISRSSNNYGPWQFPDKLIPKAILLAHHGRPIPIYDNGKQVRDWLHVDDHCSGIDLIARRGKIGETYNIGGNNERKNIDVARTILREMGKDEGGIVFVVDRPGHDQRYAIDASKIKKELGWAPRYRFEDGIKSTIAWYMSNLGWMGEITSGAYLNLYSR